MGMLIEARKGPRDARTDAGSPADSSPKLNIVHITPSLSPRAGGPATVAMHLAAAQGALGHAVSIVSSLRACDTAAFETAASGVRGFDRVNVRLKRSFSAGMIPLYRRIIPAADVVHIHGVWEPMLLLAGTMAGRHGVPYLVRPCGMLDAWSLSQRAMKKKMALWLAHRRLLNKASYIHVLTPEEAASVKALQIRAPLVTIPNGVDLREIDGAPAEAIFDRVPALRGKPYVLFLGRLHYKKGLDFLAEVFARVGQLMPELQLLVAGPDDGEEVAFRELIGRLGIGGRVHLTGALAGAEKYSAFKNAALFCLPSQQEGFSNAVIEAMAAGVPVAVSTECHFAEIERVNAGRVFPLRIEKGVEAVYDLLTKSPMQRTHIGAAGRMYIACNHTWEQVAGRTLGVYAAVVAARRGRMEMAGRGGGRVTGTVVRGQLLAVGGER